MGGQHRKIDEFIKNELFIKDKFGWELESSVIKEKNPENKEETREIKKSFYYAINKLLENDEIEIIGYEKRGKVKQSFSAHSFLFRRSKKLSYPQAKNLLNNLDLGDEKALSQLTNIFLRKFRQFVKKENKFYQEINEKVTLTPLDDWINELKKSLNKKISEYPGDPSYSPEISYIKADLNAHIRKLTKCPNARIWNIEGLSLEEYNKIMKLNRKPTQREADEKNFLNIALTDDYGKISKGEYLELKNLTKYEEKTQEKIRSIFNDVLFFVNSQENYKFMQQSFARALSDEKDSIDWLKLFIANSSSMLKKLEN